MKKLLLASLPLGIFLTAAGPTPPPNIVATAPIVVTPSGSSYAQRTISCPTCGASTGNVTGPASSTIGHLATFNNTTGTLLQDGGVPYNPATPTGMQVLGFRGGGGAPYSGSGTAAPVVLDSLIAGLCGDVRGGLITVTNGTANSSCIPAVATVGKVLTQEFPSGNLTPVWTSVPHHASYIWNTSNTVVADTIPLLDTTTTGTLASISYHVAGGTTPSFGLSIQINGVNVTGCNTLTVNSATPTTTTCTAANTFSSGQKITAVISAPSGTPTDAIVQINYSEP